jgi:hypothetical protein
MTHQLPYANTQQKIANVNDRSLVVRTIVSKPFASREFSRNSQPFSTSGCSSLFAEFFCPQLNVSDFMFRFEWQHRGSPHVHGFLWLQGAPNVDLLQDEPLRQPAIRFYDRLVSAIHPNISQQPTHPHPCQLRYSDITDPDIDLPSLLNRVQRHTTLGLL